VGAPAILQFIKTGKLRCIATGSKDRLATDAAEPVANTQAQFASFIAQEQQRWKAVIARAKIKPD
jgi:hypothetical protein